jgi:hypothetical protein
MRYHEERKRLMKLLSAFFDTLSRKLVVYNHSDPQNRIMFCIRRLIKEEKDNYLFRASSK